MPDMSAMDTMDIMTMDTMAMDMGMVSMRAETDTPIKCKIRI